MSQPTTSPFRQRKTTRQIVDEVLADEIEQERIKLQTYFDSATDNDLLKLAHNLMGVVGTPVQNKITEIGSSPIDLIWNIHLELERRRLILNFYQCFYDRKPPVYGTVDYPRANE